MKNFRRILALIVTLTMLFSMTAPAISEGVVDPTPVETPVEEKKGETPAAPAEETKDEAPAAPAEEKGETPAAPTEETKDETPAAPTEETKDETPAAPTEEKKDETPAAPSEEKKDETPVAPAEETAPASTGETAEQAPAQEPVPAAGNKEETQEAPAPAQMEEAQPVVQETAPAAAAAAAQTEEEPVPVQEETTDGVEPANAGDGSGDSEENAIDVEVYVTGSSPYVGQNADDWLNSCNVGFSEPVEGLSASDFTLNTDFTSACSAGDTVHIFVSYQENNLSTSPTKITKGGKHYSVKSKSSSFSFPVRATPPTTVNITLTINGSATNIAYTGKEQTFSSLGVSAAYSPDVPAGASVSFDWHLKGTTPATYTIAAGNYTEETAAGFLKVNCDRNLMTVGTITIVGSYSATITKKQLTVKPYSEDSAAFSSMQNTDLKVISSAYAVFDGNEKVADTVYTGDDALPDGYKLGTVREITSTSAADSYELQFTDASGNPVTAAVPSASGYVEYTFDVGEQKYTITPDTRTEVDVEVTLRNKFPDHIYDGKPYIPQFDDTVCSYSVQTASGTNLNTNIIKSVRSSNECTALGIYTWNTTMPPAVELDSDHKLRNLTVKGSTTLLIKEAPVTIDVPVTFTKDEVTYDGASHSLVPSVASRVSYTSQISGDTYNYSVTVAVNNTAQYTEAGDHVYTADSVTVTLEPEERQNAWMPDATANVTLAQTEAERTLTIKPKPVTIVPDADQSSVYGAAIADPLEYAVMNEDDEVDNGAEDALPSNFKLVTEAKPWSDVGSDYAFALSGDGTTEGKNSFTSANGNYEYTLDETVKYSITPLDVTLNLVDMTAKTYGEKDPEFLPYLQVTLPEDYVSAKVEGEAFIDADKVKTTLTEKNGLSIARNGEGVKDYENAGSYTWDGAWASDKDEAAFTVTWTDNVNFAVKTAEKTGFEFIINRRPVTLTPNGDVFKTYGQKDPDFSREYDVTREADAEFLTEIQDDMGVVLTRADLGENEGELDPVGQYDYLLVIGDTALKTTETKEDAGNFEITFLTERDDGFGPEDKKFYISQLYAYLTLKDHPWKYYSVTDDKAGLDFTKNIEVVIPASVDEDGVETPYDGCITPDDIWNVIKDSVTVTRTGAAKDKVTSEAKEQAGTYDYKNFEIKFTQDPNFIIDTIHEMKEFGIKVDDPDFSFEIKPLPVTLTLIGDPAKDYGVTDADAGIDFNTVLTAIDYPSDSSKTPKEMVSELKATVTRADAGKLSDEKVGVYEYSKAKFPIDPNPTENNNYKVTVAEKADKFTFTIKPNITIGEMKWTEGNVTTRTGNTIKASFTVPSGKPDVTLDVPMTVTAKLDLSGTNTYLTDEAKAALSALELTGTFTGKTGEIVIPEPDAMKKYVKNGDSWQGGLPVGTKLIVTGVKLGDAEGTVNGAAPAVPVSGFEVAKHEVALTMGVETVGGDAQTAYKVGENSYVVGPEATITLSHDSPLDEYVILTSAAGSKTVLVPANDTVSIKASEMNAGEYEVLGVVTCEDGLYKADSVVMTEITAAMVDDVHLDANTETGEFVLDNVANKNVKAQFENRGKQVTVTLPEATRPGSPVTVTINGMTIPAQTADGTTVTFDVFGIWSANPQNLIRSGEAINVTYTDAVGNVLTAPVSGGSVTKSAGNKITINMRTIDDDDVGSVGGDGKVRIYGEASNYEKVIISVNGTTVAIVDVTGSGNYDPSKSGQWSYVLNLADLDLSTGRVTITAVYDDLTGGDERTFNYKGEVMPVLLTSPLLEQFDKIYGFAEYGTTVHVTINGEDYNTDDNPEMFLTDDAGNTVSVYEHFPSEHDSYFYWIFQCPSRMKPDDDIQIWYEDFTGENVTPEDKRRVQVQAVSDTDAKFDNTAEVLGANVIDYLYMDKDEDGKDIPGTGEMGHNFVTPVDLNKIKEEPLTLPVLAFDGYKVGQVTFSMDDAGQLVVTPEIADDSEGAVKWGVSLFGEKPSIQALRANACGDDLAEKTFNVNGFGDKVWVSARFDVDLSYMRIGGMQDFCALAPHDSSSNNRLQSYAANLGDDNYKFYSESLSEPVIEPEVTED